MEIWYILLAICLGLILITAIKQAVWWALLLVIALIVTISYFVWQVTWITEQNEIIQNKYDIIL